MLHVVIHIFWTLEATLTSGFSSLLTYSDGLMKCTRHWRYDFATSIFEWDGLPGDT